MAGFFDYVKKSAQQTEAFVNGAKTVGKDAGLLSLALGVKGAEAVGHSPVIQNPLVENPVTNLAKQSIEFAAGITQNYLVHPAFGAVAKAGVDPTTALPFYHDASGNLILNPMTPASRLMATAPAPVQFLANNNPVVDASRAGAIGRQVLEHPVTALKHPLQTEKNAVKSFFASAPAATYQGQIQQAEQRGDTQKAQQIQQKQQAIQQASSLKGAYNAALAGNPWDNLALSVAYDPLTYLGGETELAKVPGLAEAADTSRLANAAYRGAQGVDVTANAANALLTAPFVGALKGAKWLGDATGLLNLSDKGLAAAEESKLVDAIYEWRQRGFSPTAIQTGPEKVSYFFHGMAGNEEPVLNAVNGVSDLPWKVEHKGRDLVLTTVLPRGVTGSDVRKAIAGQRISLADMKQFSQDLDGGDSWSWDLEHKVITQAQTRNPATGEIRRGAEAIEGNDTYQVYFDAVKQENGKYSALATRYRIKADGTMSDATTSLPNSYRVKPTKSFKSAQDAVNAAQEQYITGMNNLVLANQKTHAEVVNKAADIIRNTGTIDPNRFWQDLALHNNGDVDTVVSDEFAQHTYFDAINKLLSDEQRSADSMAKYRGRVAAKPDLAAVKQAVAGIAQDLGVERAGNRVSKLMDVLTPFVTNGADTFNADSIANTPQIRSAIEDALQAETPRQQIQLISNAFGEAPKAAGAAKKTLADISFPLRTVLDSTSETLPLSIAQTSPLESVTRQVQNLADAVNAPPAKVQQIMSVISPLVESNPEHFITQRVYDNPVLRNGIRDALQAKSEAEARDILANTVRETNTLWDSLGVRVPAFYKLTGWLNTKPVTMASKVGEELPGTLSAESSLTLTKAMQDLPKAGAALKDPSGYIQQVNDLRDKFISTADELAQEHGAFDPTHPLATIADATKVTEKYGTPLQKKELQAFRREWGFTDNADAETAYVNFIANKARDDLAKKYDLDYGKLNSKYQTLFGMFREKQTLSPRYHLGNITDMTVRAKLHGVNTSIASDVKKMLVADGRSGLVPGISAVAERGFGPTEAQYYGAEPLDDGFFPSISKLRRMGKETNTYKILGKVPGLAEAAGAVVALNRYLGMAVESTFREAAFGTGYLAFKQDQLVPRFEELIGKEISPDASKAFDDLIKQSDYSMPSSEVESILAQYNPDKAKELAGYWDQGLDEATKSGIDFSNQVYYKFTDQRKIESMLHLQGWLAFHAWATRNLPFYTATLAQNPWLIRAYQTYSDLSDQQRKQLNLSGSFKGKLPTGPLALPAFMIGPDNLAYFNPAVAISVYDQTKPQNTNPNETFAEKAIDTLGMAGLSPAPFINSALNILGYTTDADPQQYTWQPNLVHDFTGINPEYPFAKAQEVLRNNLSGVFRGSQYVPDPSSSPSGSAYEEYLIQRRIDQMSVEDTGYANDPQYEAAKAIPSSGIYQVAKQDVERNLVFKDLWNFIIPAPLTTINPTELAIRQAQATLPAYGTPEYQQALSSGNIGTAHTETHYGDPRQTQIDVGLMFLGQLGWPGNSRYGTVGANDVQMSWLFQNLPEFQKYYQWVQQQPPGANTSEYTYLHTVR